MNRVICQAYIRLYYDVGRNKMTGLREIFAHNLKKKRHKCKLSQAKLAEMVNVSTHHIATIETSRNYPTLDLVERMAKALNIEVYELFTDPHTPPVEMERLYQTVAKNIDQLIIESMERIFQPTAKNIEQIISETIEKTLKKK
jgi:transcriptional regulator with XRE-family HTH domain